MNKLPLDIEYYIIKYFDILTLHDFTLTNKENYNEYKNILKKYKISNKINKLNLSENTKNYLIKNMEYNICLEKYEKHIIKLSKLKLTRYSNG